MLLSVPTLQQSTSKTEIDVISNQKTQKFKMTQNGHLCFQYEQKVFFLVEWV